MKTLASIRLKIIINNFQLKQINDFHKHTVCQQMELIEKKLLLLILRQNSSWKVLLVENRILWYNSIMV